MVDAGRHTGGTEVTDVMNAGANGLVIANLELHDPIVIGPGVDVDTAKLAGPPVNDWVAAEWDMVLRGPLRRRRSGNWNHWLAWTHAQLEKASHR